MLLSKFQSLSPFVVSIYWVQFKIVLSLFPVCTSSLFSFLLFFVHFPTPIFVILFLLRLVVEGDWRLSDQKDWDWRLLFLTDFKRTEGERNLEDGSVDWVLNRQVLDGFGDISFWGVESVWRDWISLQFTKNLYCSIFLSDS